MDYDMSTQCDITKQLKSDLKRKADELQKWWLLSGSDQGLPADQTLL